MNIHFPDGLVVGTGSNPLVDYSHAHLMVDGLAGATIVDGAAAATPLFYMGLPTIGFAVVDYRNDTTTSRLRSFGATFAHKADRAIRAVP